MRINFNFFTSFSNLRTSDLETTDHIYHLCSVPGKYVRNLSQPFSGSIFVSSYYLLKGWRISLCLWVNLCFGACINLLVWEAAVSRSWFGLIPRSGVIAFYENSCLRYFSWEQAPARRDGWKRRSFSSCLGFLHVTSREAAHLMG